MLGQLFERCGKVLRSLLQRIGDRAANGKIVMLPGSVEHPGSI